MIFFSQRRKLEKLFERWAKENNVLNCPMSVVVYLQTNGLLDEEKILEFLKKPENQDMNKPLVLEPDNYTYDEWETILKVFGVAHAEQIAIEDCTIYW